MNTPLKEVLSSLNDVDFNELRSSLSIAENVRRMMKRHNLTINYLAQAFGMDVEVAFELIKGAYDFDLRIISKIESLNETLELEAAKKQIIPIINFPDYVYNTPPQSV
ncbi:MAG: hypothetical protein V4538_14990 [Bacteroidota bacterium]